MVLRLRIHTTWATPAGAGWSLLTQYLKSDHLAHKGACVMRVRGRVVVYGYFWANGSVGKNKGDGTTTRTEIETAGSGKDLGFCSRLCVSNKFSHFRQKPGIRGGEEGTRQRREKGEGKRGGVNNECDFKSSGRC